MKDSARLFNCVSCHKLTIVCSDCDRGNIYCSEQCSGAVRKTSLLEAGKRYQSTFKGRLNHAKRQAAYRARLIKKIEEIIKVTHQGSQADEPNDLLPSVPTTEKNNSLSVETRKSRCCDFCLRGEFSSFRYEFIRHHTVNNLLVASVWSQGP